MQACLRPCHIEQYVTYLYYTYYTGLFPMLSLFTVCNMPVQPILYLVYRPVYNIVTFTVYNMPVTIILIACMHVYIYTYVIF